MPPSQYLPGPIKEPKGQRQSRRHAAAGNSTGVLNSAGLGPMPQYSRAGDWQPLKVATNPHNDASAGDHNTSQLSVVSCPRNDLFNDIVDIFDPFWVESSWHNTGTKSLPSGQKPDSHIGAKRSSPSITTSEHSAGRR
jgi:hypothetical protein